MKESAHSYPKIEKVGNVRSQEESGCTDVHQATHSIGLNLLMKPENGLANIDENNRHLYIKRSNLVVKAEGNPIVTINSTPANTILIRVLRMPVPCKLD